MHYRLIKDIDEFKKAAKDWDGALLQSGSGNPFLLSDFIITWWKYYSKGKELIIFLIQDNDRIIAGIPMCLVKKKMRNIIEHIGGYAANITQPFLRDDTSMEVNFIDCFLSVLKEDSGWDIFVLDRVLESSRIPADIKTSQILNSKKVTLKYRVLNDDFNAAIDLTKGYKAVFDGLPDRLKRYITRGREKANLMGGLRLNRVHGTSQINGLFKDFREISIKSFRERNSVSSFQDAAYSNFFMEILGNFESRGRLEAHRLSAGDKTLGISFGYRFGKGFKWILTAFNTNYSSFRPGHLLIDLLIQEAISKGDTYFDMYYGGELFYKKQWCNVMVPIYKVEIYRDSLINKAVLYAQSALRANKLARKYVKGLRKIASRITNFS